MPIDLALTPSSLGSFGGGFTRPECVLCTAAGDVLVSHWRGGVSIVHGDGRRAEVLTPPETRLATNGFALTPQGGFLIANLHLEGGGVWRLSRDGQAAPFLTELDGQALPPANFVGLDRQGRTWITVSTRYRPRHAAQRPDVADGFIVLVDGKGARLVADGLGYTNEAIVDGSGAWLWVNETFARRTSRFRIMEAGLGPRETVAEYGPGTFPDGLAFDEAGGCWITSVVSNRVIRLDPDGSQQLIVEENDPAVLDEVEAAFQAGRFGPAILDKVKAEVMQSISSIAFGGPDRRTAYLGNLLDDRLYTFRSPVPGLKPAHWEVRL